MQSGVLSVFIYPYLLNIHGVAALKVFGIDGSFLKKDTQFDRLLMGILKLI